MHSTRYIAVVHTLDVFCICIPDLDTFTCCTDVVNTGVNVVGAMLGHGWKNNTAFHPLDVNEPGNSVCVLKLVV